MLVKSIFYFSVVMVGLAIDQLAQPYGLWIMSALVWAIFVLLILESDEADRKRWLTCLVIATLGEILLCEGFNMYQYREGGIPAFVPPGHASGMISKEPVPA